MMRARIKDEREDHGKSVWDRRLLSGWEAHRCTSLCHVYFKYTKYIFFAYGGQTLYFICIDLMKMKTKYTKYQMRLSLEEEIKCLIG